MNGSPIPSVVNVLRSRQAALTEEEQRLLDRLQEVRAELAKTSSDLQTAELADERSRAKGKGIPVETWRRTVRELGVFTVSELAAELGCSKPVAAKRLNAMLTIVPPMIRPAGRALGKPVFEYVRPTEEGKAFEAQQRVRDRVTPEQHAAAMVPDRPHDIEQSLIGQIAIKEIRTVARDAINAGWTLEHTGGAGHHLRLVRGKRRITLPTTPRSPGNSANILRQQLFGTNARARVHA